MKEKERWSRLLPLVSSNHLTSASARIIEFGERAHRQSKPWSIAPIGRATSRSRCFVKITRCTSFHKYSCFHNCPYLCRLANKRPRNEIQIYYRSLSASSLSLSLSLSLHRALAARYRELILRWSVPKWATSNDVANSIANSMNSMEADIGRFREIVDPRARIYELTRKSEK